MISTNGASKKSEAFGTDSIFILRTSYDQEEYLDYVPGIGSWRHHRNPPREAKKATPPVRIEDSHQYMLIFIGRYDGCLRHIRPNSDNTTYVLVHELRGLEQMEFILREFVMAPPVVRKSGRCSIVCSGGEDSGVTVDSSISSWMIRIEAEVIELDYARF